MRVRNVDTFYWVATLGSFRVAAEKLSLTQPAISARIHALEQDLGTDVFRHDLKTAELTPAGQRLFHFAERFVQLEQDMLFAFSSSANVTQSIKLGSSETLACTWLPAFIEHVAHSHPKISFELRVESSDQLRRALLARDIDLALMMGPVDEIHLQSEPLCDYDMVFAAAPSIATQHTSWHQGELGHYSLLTFASNTRPHHQVLKQYKQRNITPRSTTTSTSLSALIHLAVSGMGICALPKAAIERELSQNTLVLLDTQMPLISIAFYASYMSENPNSQMINEIIQQLQDYYPQTRSCR